MGGVCVCVWLLDTEDDSKKIECLNVWWVLDHEWADTVQFEWSLLSIMMKDGQYIKLNLTWVVMLKT